MWLRPRTFITFDADTLGDQLLRTSPHSPHPREWLLHELLGVLPAQVLPSSSLSLSRDATGFCEAAVGLEQPQTSLQHLIEIVHNIDVGSL